ncbi:MAG: hypothetical protein VX899_06840 [Myxococcota bacterium]|nr:hypothetical protein [Myxococcota bacterium]
MSRFAPALLLSLAACSTQSVDSDTTAPSHMQPTSAAVKGAGCAFQDSDWTGRANLLLDDRFDEVGSIRVDGDTLSTAEEVTHLLQSGSDAQVQWATLAVNVAMNDAGIYGQYADFGAAELTEGAYQGSTARDLLSLAGTAAGDASLVEAMGTLNSGFSGCQANWYLVDCTDVDGDGIPLEEDCDDADARIGAELYSSELGSDDGDFQPTTQLGDDWAWDGDSTYATDGGQEVQLGTFVSGTDFPANYVVYANVTAQGTEPGCGFDCLESCGDYVPEDDCYTDYQALALGILSFEVTGSGQATLTNSGDYDVCMEGYAMWDHAGSQSLVVGEDVLSGADYRIPAGGSLDLYYGSWTTDNGAYSPYLDEPSFWCYQNGTTLSPGTAYSSIGAWLPEDMQYYVGTETDEDCDSVTDQEDWTDSLGVQTQHNLWDYQDTHAAVAIGKLAESTSSGTVQVTLTAQNRGAVSTTATVTDTVPATWSLVSCDVTPDTESTNSDGSTELTWDIAFGGCTSDCASYDETVITCEIVSNLSVDMDIVELPQASADYFDGSDDETSYSMQAAAFDYDFDADGQVLCGETERWRAGILVRASVDSDQDEGYNGYRCALANNAEEECFDPGHFLQIGEFMDAPEDGINSECEGTCDNPTFDQLARADHDGSTDLSAGDSAALTFWVYGEELYCAAADSSGSTFAEATANDDSFPEGETGFSTLNMYGDFESIRVCEVFTAHSDK